ncbi:MAG: SpoIID/LytB domain-containing protein [Blastococcus sp.]
MRAVRKALSSVVVAVLGLTLLTVTLVGSSDEAQAAEFYPVPSSGVYTIDGRGYGHGHGLSQWGAQGAALKGLTASEILAFYYPGTDQHDIGNKTLRVQLSATQSSVVRVDSTEGKGMTVMDVATKATKTGPATAYRVVTTGNSQRVEIKNGSGQWVEFPLAAPGSSFAGPISFSTADGVTVFNAGSSSIARNYRGSARVVRTSSGQSVAVNHVSMENYLKGVVPKESPPSWKAAALQAQAVAARSYAWYDVAVASGRAWDLCDTTACQVYGGRKLLSNAKWTAQEAESTNDAVDRTAGIALYYNGSPAFTQFSASNGGAGSAGNKPYLTNFVDPYDGTSGNPNHTWTSSLSADYLQARYPQIGTLSGIRVISRSGLGDWGGYITALELVGDKQTIAVSARMNMKSTYWRPRDVSNPFGDLNSVTVSGGDIRLTGWSIDPDTAKPTEVHVYVGSAWGGRAVASVDRPDVAAVYPAKGAAHGYDLTVRAGPGTHRVCVYAINLGAGSSNSRIGCSDVDMGKAPIGSLDKATLTAGKLRLVGWSIDPDTTAPVAVQVQVNGRLTSKVTADVSRYDVGRAYPASGSRHGYDTTVGLSASKNTVCVFAIDTPTGAGNTKIGCTTVTFGAPPVGDINSVTVSGSAARVVGWALDPDTADSIEVHVYVDGKNSKVATAAVARADIARAYPAHGSRHGFDVTLKLTAGKHSVCLYGIDVPGGGRSPQLKCSSVTVRSTSSSTATVPIGTIDSAKVDGRTVTLRGWALDRDLPATRLQVHIYVDGRWTRAVTASERRVDVGAAYPGVGAFHGWTTQLGMSSGKHRVCAYGINVGGGSTNPLLRCVDVRVP